MLHYHFVIGVVQEDTEVLDVVRELLREGSIRFIRLSGDDDGIRIRPETLEQFLDEQEQLEDDEPEAPPSVPKKEIALKNLTLDS